MQSVKTYFVTGATGVIGSTLIPILLEDTNSRVKLLIRAGSTAEMNTRMEALYRFWRIAPDDESFRKRIQALRGDVTSLRLGLEEMAYTKLSADCTHIIHSAANVRMNLALEEARRSAVDSARNIVKLGRDCSHLEKIEFVSTVGVGGNLAQVPETWISEPRVFHNTYEQSKAEAEDYIRIQVEQGLPLTVHRPSMVVGSSQTGNIIHFQIFYYLCEFLSGRRTFGIFPRLAEATLDTIPVDFVANAIVWSSGQADTVGKILHLCSGPDYSLRLADLREQVRMSFIDSGLKVPKSVFDISPEAFGIFLNLLAWLNRAETSRAIRALPVFLTYLATKQAFQIVRTQKLLASAKMEVPSPHKYLRQVLDYYLSRLNYR